MNWGEFKQYVEEAGVGDDMEITSIDIFNDAEPEVEIKGLGGPIVIYQ